MKMLIETIEIETEAAPDPEERRYIIDVNNVHRDAMSVVFVYASAATSLPLILYGALDKPLFCGKGVASIASCISDLPGLGSYLAFGSTLGFLAASVACWFYLYGSAEWVRRAWGDKKHFPGWTRKALERALDTLFGFAMLLVVASTILALIFGLSLRTP